MNAAVTITSQAGSKKYVGSLKSIVADFCTEPEMMDLIRWAQHCEGETCERLVTRMGQPVTAEVRVW